MNNEDTSKRAADYGLPAYFDIQAKMGHTKHLGGKQATDDLAALCQIGEGQTVLNVGSGSGISATYLVQTFGCKVIGIDILPGMVKSAKKWAHDKKLSEYLEFRVADARDLPFEDNRFDALISESVNTFIPDREIAMREYIRVVKPGGNIGFNEAIWVKEPSEKMAEIITETTNQVFKSPQVWVSLFKDAGLTDLVADTYPMGMRAEASNQKGLLSLGDYLRIFGKMIGLLFKDSETRRLLKYASSNPRQYFEYMGYGLFVGKKPTTFNNKEETTQSSQIHDNPSSFSYPTQATHGYNGFKFRFALEGAPPEEKMMQIVTDSGTDTILSPEEMDALNITVVPLNVTLDGKTYREGIDIEPGDFYDLLDASENMPTTSQPSAVISPKPTEIIQRWF